MTGLRVIQMGRCSYEEGYAAQVAHHEEVLAAREAGSPEVGRLLLVEHDPPVITISRRPGAAGHLLASEALLRREGIEVRETDRGGDITYHGPGQQVVYPIIDLASMGLRLHEYLRLLEEIVIDLCAGLGLESERDCAATGVWIRRPRCTPEAPAKICAIGIRVRRWVTMHGLALNVQTDLSHFGLIVPCGLAGRPVTSLAQELVEACPSMEDVRADLVDRFERRVAPDRAGTVYPQA